MNSRERLKDCYELAFYPLRLNGLWCLVKEGRISDLDEVGAMVDTALLLHQTLPSDGYASQRALNRLALYQAKARAFGTVRFLENLRRRMGREGRIPNTIPASLVRDIALPRLAHTR